MSTRSTLGIWIFVSMIMIILFRANLSIVILAMVQKFDANGTKIEMPDVCAFRIISFIFILAVFFKYIFKLVWSTI